MSVTFEYPYDSPTRLVTLRNPTLGNLSIVNYNTKIRRAINGNPFSHIRSPNAESLRLNFTGIKDTDMDDFILLHFLSAGRDIRYTDHDGLIHRIRILTTPIERSTIGRGSELNEFSIDARKIPSNTHSMLFDGSTQYGTITHSSDFNITPDLTVAAWVNSAPFTVAGASGYIAIHSGTWQMQVRNQAAGGLWIGQVQDGGGNTKRYQSTIRVSDSQPHHIAMTFGGGVFKIFVDGIEELAPTKFDDDAMAVLNSPNVVNLGIADDPAAAGPNAYPGSIGDLVVANADIGAYGVAVLYGMGYVPPLEEHPNFGDFMGHWRMGELTDTTTTVFDRINSNNIALTAAPVIQEQTPA